MLPRASSTPVHNRKRDRVLHPTSSLPSRTENLTSLVKMPAPVFGDPSQVGQHVHVAGPSLPSLPPALACRPTAPGAVSRQSCLCLASSARVCWGELPPCSPSLQPGVPLGPSRRPRTLAKALAAEHFQRRLFLPGLSVWRRVGGGWQCPWAPVLGGARGAAWPGRRGRLGPGLCLGGPPGPSPLGVLAVPLSYLWAALSVRSWSWPFLFSGTDVTMALGDKSPRGR